MWAVLTADGWAQSWAVWKAGLRADQRAAGLVWKTAVLLVDSLVGPLAVLRAEYLAVSGNGQTSL